MTEIITTGDGSHSLLNRELNETYHSVHGALTESMHVFIQNGLRYTQRRGLTTVRILEIGFGTGLNTLLSLREASAGAKIHYTTLELFPLAPEIWEILNYGNSIGMSPEYASLHQAGWNTTVQIRGDFILNKLHVDLHGISLEDRSFNLVYYDAFAPSRQPDMWTLSTLEKVVRWMAADSVFVTYCAKGQLKRDLKSLGLHVETLPGPPGKKEMVRALKPNF